MCSIDLFQNDVTKRRRSRDKTSLLAKELASVLFMYYLTCEVNSVQAILHLESAASEVELLEALKQLTVKLLKDLCREKSLKL